MPDDDLAPSVTRSSLGMILIIHGMIYKLVIIMPDDDLAPSVTRSSPSTGVKMIIQEGHTLENTINKQVPSTKDITMVSCQKGPTRHAYAWQIGPFWQDTLKLSPLLTHWNRICISDSI